MRQNRRITREALRNANRILDFAGRHLRPEWDLALQIYFTADACKWTYRRLDGRRPLGFIHDPKPQQGRAAPMPVGLGQIREALGMSMDEFLDAVGLLKRAGRIMQCGQGRGRVILVLRKSPVTLADFVASARRRRTR